MSSEMIEKLKEAIWNEGTHAIFDFIGYDTSCLCKEDVFSFMDDVIDQMYEEELKIYYAMYC